MVCFNQVATEVHFSYVTLGFYHLVYLMHIYSLSKKNGVC